jgi:hypothetical protein
LTTSSACLDNIVDSAPDANRCGGAGPETIALPNAYGDSPNCPNEWATNFGIDLTTAYSVQLLAPGAIDCANTQFTLDVMGFATSLDPNTSPRWISLGSATSSGTSISSGIQCAGPSITVPATSPYGIFPGHGAPAFFIGRLAVVAQAAPTGAPAFPVSGAYVSVTPTFCPSH